MEQGIISQFPDEILLQIFCEVDKLGRCSSILLVCKRWKRIYVAILYHEVRVRIGPGLLKDLAFTLSHDLDIRQSIQRFKIRNCIRDATHAVDFKKILQFCGPGLRELLIDVETGRDDVSWEDTDCFRLLEIHGLIPLGRSRNIFSNLHTLLLEGEFTTGMLECMLDSPNLRRLGCKRLRPDFRKSTLKSFLDERRGTGSVSSLELFDSSVPFDILKPLLEWPKCLESLWFYGGLAFECMLLRHKVNPDEADDLFKCQQVSLKTMSINSFTRETRRGEEAFKKCIPDFSQHVTLTHATFYCRDLIERTPSEIAARMPPNISNLCVEFGRGNFDYDMIDGDCAPLYSFFDAILILKPIKRVTMLFSSSDTAESSDEEDSHGPLTWQLRMIERVANIVEQHGVLFNYEERPVRVNPFMRMGPVEDGPFFDLPW